MLCLILFKESENASSYNTKSGLPRLPSRPPSQHNKELWNIFMSSQNLPAVLNDPNRGKQVHSNSVYIHPYLQTEGIFFSVISSPNCGVMTSLSLRT
jgi:hypothetical protein